MDDFSQYRDEIAKFYRSHKRMPTFSELMKLWGYKTKSAVNYKLDQMIDAGLVRKDKTGRLLPHKIEEEEGLKLLGLVEAGFPSPAEEELLDVLSFDEYLTPNKESSYI